MAESPYARYGQQPPPAKPPAASPYAAYAKPQSPYAAYAPGSRQPAPAGPPVGGGTGAPGFGGGLAPSGAQVAAGLVASEQRTGDIARETASLRKFTDPSSPEYKGPAYSITTGNDGRPVLRKSTDPIILGDQAAFESGRGQYSSGQPRVSADIPANVQALLSGPGGTQAPGSTQSQVSLAGRTIAPGSTLDASGRPVTAAPITPAATIWEAIDRARREQAAQALQGAMDAEQAQQDSSDSVQGPGKEAADINRKRINELLGGLETYANDIYALSKDNTGLSLAEAQLEKGQKLANMQAAQNLQTTQAGALAAARSSRSRGDRALLERQAIGEQAYLGQESQRQGAMRQAEFEGNQAILRAQEEDADRRFRLDALSKASELGLNTAALETDISKANLDSATNWVNQQFNQMGIDKQITQEQAQMLLGYTRDMAAIQFQYDQLSVEEQQAAEQLIMQKYGIDEGTRVQMKQIKEAGKFRWDNVLAGMAGGAGSALTAGAGKLIGLGG